MTTPRRNWVFTLNNPEVDDVPVHPDETYVIWQTEVGESGTRHLQGYIELSRAQRLSNMRSWLPRAHFEPRKGNRVQARDYCCKSDTRVAGPWERGDFRIQGKRTDIDDAVEIIQADADLPNPMQRVARECPNAYVKFHKGFAALARQLRSMPRDEGFEPRPWQQEVLNYAIETQGKDRGFLWVYDKYGGQGKSRLVRHLVLEHGAIMLEGKVADMSCAYDGHPIACIDISRSSAEYSDHMYTFAEKLKNGVIFSSKYESGMKVFKIPAVIFFANHRPDLSKCQDPNGLPRVTVLNITDYGAPVSSKKQARGDDVYCGSSSSGSGKGTCVGDSEGCSSSVVVQDQDDGGSREVQDCSAEEEGTDRDCDYSVQSLDLCSGSSPTSEFAQRMASAEAKREFQCVRDASLQSVRRDKRSAVSEQQEYDSDDRDVYGPLAFI